MTLAEYQRAFAACCLGANQKLPEALATDARGWALYRTMVRSRFKDALGAQLPRTQAWLGESEFAARVDAYLASCPPRARHLRELSTAFLRHAERTWPKDETTGTYALDLARYECALREVAGSEDRLTAPFDGPFTLERAASLDVAHRVIAAGWNVHCDDVPIAGSFNILVYRCRATLAIETVELSSRCADLVARLANPLESVGTAIRTVLATRDALADPSAVDEVTECITLLIEGGTLVGSAPDDPLSTT